MTKYLPALALFLIIGGTGLIDGMVPPPHLQAHKEIPGDLSNPEKTTSLSEGNALPGLADIVQPPFTATIPPPTPQMLPTQRYRGLIQNLSKYDISIPSANSDATLIVPAHAWLEYVTWEPEIRLFGFVDGKQVYFQRLRVRPGAYQYLGNSYDFVATIQPVPPQSR